VKRDDETKKHLQILFKLTKKEIDVYFQLLINEKLTATELSQSTKIQRTRIYEVIRSLKENGLVELRSIAPKEFSAIAPRKALDNWLFQRRKLFEEESSNMLSLLPSLQGIWNNRHEEFLGSRVTLITEDLVKEILPIEVQNAKKHLYLAIRDPTFSSSTATTMFERLFDPSTLVKDIENLSHKGVKLHILIGNQKQFIQRTSSHLQKTLENGLKSENIIVKSLGMSFPQSFMLVDDIRIYLFFLDSNEDSHSEALRAESLSLVELFKLMWDTFWTKARPIHMKNH